MCVVVNVWMRTKTWWPMQIINYLTWFAVLLNYSAICFTVSMRCCILQQIVKFFDLDYRLLLEIMEKSFGGLRHNWPEWDAAVQLGHMFCDRVKWAAKYASNCGLPRTLENLLVQQTKAIRQQVKPQNISLWTAGRSLVCQLLHLGQAVQHSVDSQVFPEMHV